MKGIDLSAIAQNLYHVDQSHTKKPSVEIDNIVERLELGKARKYFDFVNKDVFSHLSQFSLPVLKNFSFDELCKLKYSTIISMHKSVQDLFEDSDHHEVVRKITSSMWRWGSSSGVWNEVVDAYNSIRSFSLDLNSDFDIRLDYTIGSNDYGYSKFTRTYLDGVFAYVVYYKGKHVMTIGFTITGGKRILLQQIQLVEKTGNRFLFKFPKNRLEHILGRFKEYFEGYEVYLIDGNSLLDKITDSYISQLASARKWLTYYVAQRNHTSSEDHESLRKSIILTRKEIKALEKQIRHINTDRSRLVDFYKNTGKFQLGETLEISGLQLNRVA